MAAPWLEIRCKSAACTTPGGRILYRERVGGLVSVRYRHGRGSSAGSGMPKGVNSIIMIGVPVLLICACGWKWRNESLEAILEGIEGLCEAG